MKDEHTLALIGLVALTVVGICALAVVDATIPRVLSDVAMFALGGATGVALPAALRNRG